MSHTLHTLQMPLHGVRVVEFEGIGPGPLAARMLADMGAEVITLTRAEQAAAARRLGGAVENPLRRGKTVEVIDLKSPEGKARALDLIAQADALIEGFRPGVMERLGFGPAECAARNPRLVYGRMTGWGQDGPLAQAAGHDMNYVALTGLLSLITCKCAVVAHDPAFADYAVVYFGASLVSAAGVDVYRRANAPFDDAGLAAVLARASAAHAGAAKVLAKRGMLTTLGDHR